MAATFRSPRDRLIEDMAHRYYSFDFFQAVRLLENAYPEFPRVGYSLLPREDVVRFGQRAFVVFAPSSIQDFVRGNVVDPVNQPHRMYVYFFGLIGPNGPMPEFLTQAVLDRRRYPNCDSAPGDFLDVLTHRLCSFFYRAWASNQKTVDFERSSGRSFSFYFSSLLGASRAAAGKEDYEISSEDKNGAIREYSQYYYLGHLISYSRPLEGLVAILADFFGCKVKVQEFIGRWLPLPENSVCRLGQSPGSGSLGINLIAGCRVWECQQTIRLQFGPLRLVQYLRMLPGTDSFKRLRAWVTFYLGYEIRCELNLLLSADQVPKIELGNGARVGLTTWIRSREMERDVDDLCVELSVCDFSD
ncbi:MAG: type VI secretion system baseplate subunit TssG [Verrucomicrobiae bacterium]|nr:type VI secretion system baseplate subunit TssG [Verrucomicrobiae bacterium]